MKKLNIILLAAALLFGMVPQTAMAEESSVSIGYDQELTQYLTEVSNERGFTVTKEDIEALLGSYGLDLSYFSSADEMRYSFGEVIKADYSNLDLIYYIYDLDLNSLTQLLANNGEELKDYLFLDQLDYAVYFYTDGILQRQPDFDEKLTEYLTEISAQRGFEVTIEALKASLRTSYSSLEDFQTVEELRSFMGEVIKADYSNLTAIYDEYDLDAASLQTLLEQNGKSLKDYIYVEILDYDVYTFSGAYYSELFDDPMLADTLAEFDITEEELQNTLEYFITYQNYFADPVFIDKLTDLSERMADFEDAEDITPAQIDEMISLLQEYFQLLKITPAISITQDGKETQFSMKDLFTIAEQDPAIFTEADGITIAIYGEDSQLLVDLKITGDLLESLNGLVDETVDDIEAAAEEVKVQPAAPVNETTPDRQVASDSRTENGGRLPKTAANYLPDAAIGLFLLSTGLYMNKKVKNVKKEAAVY